VVAATAEETAGVVDIAIEETPAGMVAVAAFPH